MGFQAWWRGWMFWEQSAHLTRNIFPNTLPSLGGPAAAGPRLLFKVHCLRSKVSTEPRVLCSILRPWGRSLELVQHDAQGSGATFPPGSWDFTQPQSPALASPNQGPCNSEIAVVTLFPPTAPGPTWILFTSFLSALDLAPLTLISQEGHPLGVSAHP